MKEPVKVMLPCGHCDGTGRKEAPKLSRTLAALSASRWLSTQALAKKLETQETAMSNRLAELRELGLVERQGSGARYSPYEWKLKTEKGSP